jgi:hypothetical protein
MCEILRKSEKVLKIKNSYNAVIIAISKIFKNIQKQKNP